MVGEGVHPGGAVRVGRAVGAPLTRLEGAAKLTGAAPYAFEHPLPPALFAFPLTSTEACGEIVSVDAREAEALPGVRTVLTHLNALRLREGDDRELAVLQSPEVFYRGQFIGVVVAESSETAREAAALVRFTYRVRPHEVVLDPDRSDLYTPERVNGGALAHTEQGDADAAAGQAAFVHDAVYTTPAEYNNPMEPHTTVALWEEDADGLTLYDSTQGVHSVLGAVTPLFGLLEEQVRVVCPHVGGAFGSKGTAHAHVVLAALAARAVPGEPVKLALPRQLMFGQTGYRTPTVQRVRLSCDADGRLSSVTHEVVSQTARFKEFAEQAAVPTRTMYAAPNRRTTHRLAALDVPAPSWMRAPGECPGMFALESAMDELAVLLGVDPIELRVRNEPQTDPDTGLPFSSRNLVACLREGARRFGWAGRDPRPGSWVDGRLLVGTGVTASTYPVWRPTGSAARVRCTGPGTYRVEVAGADLGTGTWTVLSQVAADALDVPVTSVDLRIGDSSLPPATVAGGSSGLAAYSSAVVAAVRTLREDFGDHPPVGAQTVAGTPELPAAQRYASHAFGAQFVEVRVDRDTGEVRVPRLLGVFAAGRIVNPRLARSQFLGGMTMGVSMALFERGVVDPVFGHVVNHDLADYHVAANADIGWIDAVTLEEDDPHVNPPLGTKGIGEIGVVGTAAAVANAVHHATGVRVRDLPITPDVLVTAVQRPTGTL